MHNHYQILDNLLGQFKESNLTEMEIDIYWLSQNLDHSVDPYIKKLEDDKYIDKLANGRRQLSVEGRFLLDSGGYVKKVERDKSLEDRVAKNEVQIRIATVFAAIFAGLLLLWEVFKYFNDICLKK